MIVYYVPFLNSLTSGFVFSCRNRISTIDTASIAHAHLVQTAHVPVFSVDSFWTSLNISSLNPFSIPAILISPAHMKQLDL